MSSCRSPEAGRRPLRARPGSEVHAQAPRLQVLDHKHLVASAQGIDDMRIKVRRDGSLRFRTTAKHAQMTAA